VLTPYMQDNSDHQYRTFRNNIPALSGLVALFFTAKLVFSRVRPAASTPDNRIRFIVAFILAMQIGLHGAGALKVAAILAANYAIGRSLKDARILPYATWAFNLTVLFANEWYDGYRFAHLHPSLGGLVRFYVLRESGEQALNFGVIARAGLTQWRISSLAHHFQHNDVAAHFVQHGLALGYETSRAVGCAHCTTATTSLANSSTEWSTAEREAAAGDGS